MLVKQNALDHNLDYLKAADVVETSLFVDDCLTGAESVDKVIDLHQKLVALLTKGGFILCKLNSSDPKVMDHIEPEL